VCFGMQGKLKHALPKKMVQVTRSQHCPPPSCTALNIALRARTIRRSTPQSCFLQPRDRSFPLAAAFCLSQTEPPLVTAFRSPATVASFKASIPGSKFPACYFACLPALPQPVGSSAPLPPASSLLATAASLLVPLLLPRPAPRMARPASTPLRDFCLPKDQSVRLAGHPAARLPIPPDLRSLPAAFN